MSAQGAAGLPVALPTRAPSTGSRAAAVAVRVAAVLGVLLGVAALTFKAQAGGYAAADIALDGASGFLFLAAGAVAHHRRPANRVGALMVAVGIAWFAEDLQLAMIPLVFTGGLLLTAASTGFVVHLVLAFPSGRTTSAVQRTLVATAYGMALGLVPFGALFADPRADGMAKPPNLLLLHHAPELTAALATVTDVIGIVVATGVAAVLLRRWIHATRPLRLVLAPVFVTGLVGAAASFVAGLLDDGSPLYAAALDVYKVAFCLLPLGFLAGVLRVRLGRTAVGTLLGELRAPHTPAELRDLFARALGDRSLQVAYWRPDVRSYVDGEGKSLLLPVDRAVTMVEHDGMWVAALVHDPALREDAHVLQAVTAAAGLVLENQRLAAEVRAQLAEVRASRARIVAAADAERRRVERNLHDGAQQRLVTAALGLRLAEKRLDADPETRVLIARSAESLEIAVAELRELARGIHPALLTDAGLVPALEALAQRCPLPVELAAPAVPRLAGPIEATAYFVAAEALTNVVKHAHATRARIVVSHDGATLHVRIDDDGAGGADMAAGSGLLGLRDRLLALEGELRVDSTAGAGTCVSARLPSG